MCSGIEAKSGQAEDEADDGHHTCRRVLRYVVSNG